MNRLDYVQGVVRTRVMEKELLSTVKLEQMIEVKNVHTLWQSLKTTAYAQYVEDSMDFYDYEKVFIRALVDEFKKIREIAIDPEVITLLTLKYDYHNVKVLLKELILQSDLSTLYSPLGSIPIEMLQKMIEEDGQDECRQYIQVAIKKTKTDYEKTKDPQRIETLLDHFYIKELYTRTKTLQMPLFQKYVKAMVDFINIHTVIRVQKQKKDMSFLKEVLLNFGNIEYERILYALHDPIVQMVQKFRNEKVGRALEKGLQAYERTNQLTTFEKEMDNYLIEIINEAKHIHFGPEPLLAYLFKKEMEIKNLRVIFVSKLNDIPIESIKKRMRDFDG